MNCTVCRAGTCFDYHTTLWSEMWNNFLLRAETTSLTSTSLRLHVFAVCRLKPVATRLTHRANCTPLSISKGTWLEHSAAVVGNDASPSVPAAATVGRNDGATSGLELKAVSNPAHNCHDVLNPLES